MVRLASARWRARRGEPQAEQRRTPISRSAEQSRQKQRGPAVSKEVTARRAPNWGRRARRRELAALRQRWSDAVPPCWQKPSRWRRRASRNRARSAGNWGPRRHCAASPGRPLSRPGTGPAARVRPRRKTAPEAQRFQRLRAGCEQAFSRGRFAFPLTFGVYFGATMPESRSQVSYPSLATHDKQLETTSQKVGPRV